MSTAQCDQAQGVMLQTLSRAKERHFAGEKVLNEKIRKEGVNFPECFTEGVPCTAGGAFVLDVHNVDAYAHARFGYRNNEWTVSLNLYQNNSFSSVKVDRSGPKLPELLQTVAGTLFELESGVEMTSSLSDVDVYINQKLVGKLPLKMKTPVGEQSITFKKEGYVSETWTFTAEKGGIYTKSVELKPEVTQLTILANAEDAHVFIDGEEWGLANETHSILPGDHSLELVSDTHHTYTQDYKVYPRTPQTVQVAMLPNSRSHYEIRHDGIGKYRLSANIGAHFAWQRLRFEDERLTNATKPNLPNQSIFMGGLSAALNYENKYWGATFLRVDFGVNRSGKISPETQNASFVSVYAQARAHYTISMVQFEASLGLGFAHTQIDYSSDLESKLLSDNAFSIDFSVGMKYFFSEESFMQISYDLQYDTVSRGEIRHGLTVGIGIQIPAWMRTDDAPPVEMRVEEDLSLDLNNSQDELPNSETIDSVSSPTTESSQEINELEDKPTASDFENIFPVDDELPNDDDAQEVK